MSAGQWMWRLLAGSVLIGGSLAAFAAAQIQVETVQAPAWLERGSWRQPLVAGQSLKNRDRVVTGTNARVLLRLAEGSAVKLGENASLRVDALGVRERGVFSAAFDVSRGAFRFTTGVFARFQGRRAVNIRIGTVTAGIRGTDLWGLSDAERDLLCLIEGRTTVVHAEADPMVMSEPLTVYETQRGQAPSPLSAAERGQLAKWVEQTEVQPGAVAFGKRGAWKVALGVVGSEDAALALYDRVRAAGYPVRIRPLAASGGGFNYALWVPQIVSRADAESLAVRLRLELGLESARALN